MELLSVVEREEFAAFINSHKELDGKPFESNSVSSMMYLDDKGVTQAQAIYYRVGKPIYKIRKEYISPENRSICLVVSCGKEIDNSNFNVYCEDHKV